MPGNKPMTRFMSEMAAGLLLSMFSGVMVSILLISVVMILPSYSFAGEGSGKDKSMLLNRNQRVQSDVVMQAVRSDLYYVIKTCDVKYKLTGKPGSDSLRSIDNFVTAARIGKLKIKSVDV